MRVGNISALGEDASKVEPDMDLKPEMSIPPVPITVRIGVTGHRKLANEDLVRKSVQLTLTRLDEMLKDTPHSYLVLSPLAEGADRLVAKEVLAWQSKDAQPASLEAPLPMAVEEYVKDFHAPESQDEFRKLLARASRRLELDSDISKFEQNSNDSEGTSLQKKENRRHAYRRVGLWEVDNCDILIAIWDGGQARGAGGTAEIVEYARSIRRSIVWIDSESGDIKEEKYEKHLLKAFEHHAAYNAEKVKEGEIAAEIAKRFANLCARAQEAQLDSDLLEPLRKSVFSYFVRAATLASRYQKKYLKAGTWVYILAATSVATVTVVTVFLEGRVVHLGRFQIAGGKLIWLEVAQIVGIILLLSVSTSKAWHRKWIEYRFLAERLRAAMFLWVSGVPCEPPMAKGHQSVSDEWTVETFKWICSACPVPKPTSASLEAVKNFLLSVWIGDQLRFYQGKSREHGLRHELLEAFGYGVFGLTAVAATWHALLPGHAPQPASSWLPNAVASFAIILPAVGAALAGIRTFREHLRNSKRYESMAKYLSSVVAKIEMEGDVRRLQEIFLEANDVMMREHSDWRVIMLPMEIQV